MTTTTGEGVMTIRTEVFDSLSATKTILSFLRETYEEPSKEKLGTIGTMEAIVLAQDSIDEEMKYREEELAKRIEDLDKLKERYRE